MVSLNVNDVIYFRESSKHNKSGFIGYDDYGKVIISDKMFNRGGFFKIEKIIKEKERCYIVHLGERVIPDDLYPDVNLDEAKLILKEHGFEIYEKKCSFKDCCNDDRDEVQLLAWHKKHNIFINGTTWRDDGKDVFNNLYISAPNYLRSWSLSFYSIGQFCTSIDEITIDVRCSRYKEKILTDLIQIADSLSDNQKICMMTITKDNKIIMGNLQSYISDYMYSNSLADYDRYTNDVYNELPESGKAFIRRNTITAK